MSKDQEKHRYLINVFKEISAIYLEKTFETEAKHYQVIITLTAGIVFLGVTFLDKLVPFKEANLFSFLILSWVLHGLTIMYAMFSNIFSAYCKDETSGIFFQFILDEDYNELVKRCVDMDKNTCWLYINASVTTVLFLLGVISLILFIVSNKI